MPGKRKLLPQPCPVCESEYGTIQFVGFGYGRSIICRIGHYSPKRYNKAVDKSKQDRSNYSKDYDPEKDKRNSQRIWHNFRSEHDFYEREFSKWDWKLGYNVKNKSITFPMTRSIYQEISVHGWRMKPNHSSRYRGRERKDLDY